MRIPEVQIFPGDVEELEICRRGNLLRRTILSAAVATLLLSTQHLNAASKAEKQQAAEELVKEALNREVYGLDKERDELLKRAAEQVPGFAPAMWHQGFVRHKNERIPSNELPQRLATDPRMMQYEQVRADHPDTIQGHLAIAQWCHKRGLEGQERAHLTEVLQHTSKPLGSTSSTGIPVHRRQLDACRRDCGIC